MANKPSKKPMELFAPIDHLVIDSPAFADLNGAAVRLLIIIARQYDGRNNGNLQATYRYCKQRGIGSEGTLQNAIAELISHGFIYRTRSHGFEAGKNTHSRYAITWRKLTDNTKGLFLNGFKMRAWQKWPFDENSDPQKVQGSPPKKCSFINAYPPESEGNRPPKSEDYELLAINTVFSEVSRLDYLSARLRKQAIKRSKQGRQKNWAFSSTIPRPHKLHWRC